MKSNYLKIQTSIDSMIAKYGSEKVSDYLVSISSYLGKDETLYTFETLMFITSVKLRIPVKKIRKSEETNPSTARMIMQHIMVREELVSMGKVAELFDTRKGSVHRFVTNMDIFLKNEKNNIEIVKTYNIILDELKKFKQIKL